MRSVIFALLIVTYGFSVRADSMLQNGDFADGSNHWQGDGKSPQDYAKDHPAAINDPLMSKGLIVPLDEHAWTKVTQDFKGNKSNHYVLNVSYKVSPDLAVSTNMGDYMNVTNQIRFEGYEDWGPTNIEVGRFFVTVINLGDSGGYYEKFPPKLGSKDVQTFFDPGQPLTPMGNDMVTLAFPPGKGSVIILGITVTSN